MKKTGKMIFIGLVLAFLYLPILVLAVYSFTKSTNIGAIRGFSMHNYVTLFSTPELVNMITGTIALALGASALATILGTVGAIGSFYSKLKQMDSSIYEAALDLGATPFTALTRVVIPQIMPGIVSGFALSVTLSLDDYFVATYTKPATFDTISTYVVNATKGAQTNIKTALWALSTVIFLCVVLLVLIMNIRSHRAERRGS